MSLPRLFVLAGSLIGLVIAGVVGYLVLQPPGSLTSNIGFSKAAISPNADGVDDVAVFSYKLSRSAVVTLALTNEAGQKFVFRDQQRRIRGDHRVDFSGVVSGFSLPGDGVIGTIERRLLPSGRYTWIFEARGKDGKTERHTGTLIIENADAKLPTIDAFEVSSAFFTPNQDGVRDRIKVNVFLGKPATLVVYLEDQAGNRHYLSERLLGRDPGDEGNHEFDYDGGVDDGFEPPPDGDYTLYAVAQDAEGQRIVRTTSITLQDGGLPQAEIAVQSVGATVCFSVLPWDDRYYTTRDQPGELIAKPEGSCSDLSTLVLEQGNLLVFHLTVRNYGKTPIRTYGPFAGTVYEFDQLPSTLGYLGQDGTYRIGIQCETMISDHPWRWGLGRPEDLEVIDDPELDDTFYYLRPGQSVEVWGAIRMARIFEQQNPQDCAASLIHEGVNIDPFQLGVGRREIRIMPKTTGN
jgi:hypothetical protein